ncbi:hypothetical protein ABT086_02630 [Streptomyces mirabilis]
MRQSISRIAPIVMGFTIAAFDVVTLPAAAQPATPGPDLLGVSQSATAPTNPGLGTPSAEASRTTSGTSRAPIVNVTSCSESDLQAAIGSVATVGGTVNLRPGCTYTLTDTVPPNDDNGLPVIKNSVTINLRGDIITRAATAGNFRFFEINGPNGNLTLNTLTLSNGHAATGLGNGRGGAIWLNGAGSALTLNNSSLTTNTADTFGGAIENDSGAVSVNRSTLHNNKATAGGAVFVNPFGGSGTATFDRSRITGNHATILAGGIAQAGTMTLKRSEVIGNTTTGAKAQGGGIFNTSGTVQLTRSPVAGNTTNGTNSRGGGIFNAGSGSVALTRSPVTNNQALGTGADGGGVFKASGTVTRDASPIVRNRLNNCGSPSTVTGCS